MAEPVSADENLDITAPKLPAGDALDVAKTPLAKEDDKKTGTNVPVLTSAEEGLSVTQKLFLIGAIVALCALFLRSRGGQSTATMGGLKEKSMA